MNQFLAYIKFLYNSTNQHGVHSPFVYNLLTKCLYRKDKKPGLEIVRSYRKALVKDEQIIEVKDFGAGSRVFKSNARKVSQIAKHAGITKSRAYLLNRLTSYLNVESALELGTSVGISSAAIAAGNRVKLISLEGCPETAKIAQEYFIKFKLENVDLITGSFEETLKHILPPRPANPLLQKGESVLTPDLSHHSRPPGTIQKEGENRSCSEEGTKKDLNDNNQPLEKDNQSSTKHSPINHYSTNQYINDQSIIKHLQTYDLIYFDGDHEKEATLKYFHQLLPLAHNDSVFIFDDIHWSKGMEEAWEEIKKHPQVRVSIDSFFWGLVFFRKEQEKENFILRL